MISLLPLLKEKNQDNAALQARRAVADVLPRNLGKRDEIADAQKLKFKLNGLQKIISCIIDWILTVLCIRSEFQIKKNLNETSDITLDDLKNMKPNVQTWADQIRFDEAVDVFVEKKNQELSRLH